MEFHSGVFCAINGANIGAHSPENPVNGYDRPIALNRILLSGYCRVSIVHAICILGATLKGVARLPLTVLDIANKEFKTSIRGYNQDEVDEFLDEVMRNYEALIRENDELRQSTAGMGEKLEQYRALEQTLQNTLVVAQSTADDMKQAARKEAELIVREAEARARELIQKAEDQVVRQRDEMDRLKRETEQFRARVKSLLESQLALLNQGFSLTEHASAQALEPSR